MAEHRRFPAMTWLNGHLSRKMLLILVGIALLSWALVTQGFLSYLSAYVREIYSAAEERSAQNARSAAAVLTQQGLSGLEQYARKQNLRCVVREADGSVVFLSDEATAGTQWLVSSGETFSVTYNGRPLTLQTWSEGIPSRELSSALRQRALAGLTVINVFVFVAAAILIYLIVVAPIVRLRKTMRLYYEHGALPERSQRQDEIGKLQNTFSDMVGVLQAKEQAERRLVASISHDIKTPLTSVMGCSERLISGRLTPEKQQQYLRCVYDKALSIKSLVDEFDEYLDVGLHSGEPMRLITAGELCDILRSEYGGELQEAGVAFRIDCQDPESRFICSLDHMKRFFGNLIGNSIHHAGAAQLQLTLTCRKLENQIEFRFTDNGKGVKAELLSEIFEPFYTTDRGRKVSGLGLSICRSIIKAHGGGVFAETAPGGGLCIRAVLPLAESTNNAQAE